MSCLDRSVVTSAASFTPVPNRPSTKTRKAADRTLRQRATADVRLLGKEPRVRDIEASEAGPAALCRALARRLGLPRAPAGSAPTWAVTQARATTNCLLLPGSPRSLRGALLPDADPGHRHRPTPHTSEVLPG